jgi:hypothetical protein
VCCLFVEAVKIFAIVFIPLYHQKFSSYDGTEKMLLFSFVKFGYLFLLLYRNYKQYGGLTVPKIRGHSEVPPLIGISGSWNVGPETSGLDPSTRDDCSRDQRTATDTKEPVFEWQHDFIVQGIFQPRIVACIRSSVISLLLQRQ